MSTKERTLLLNIARMLCEESPDNEKRLRNSVVAVTREMQIADAKRKQAADAR